MNNETGTVDHLLDVLKEREKELNCLYKVDEILSNHQLTLPELFSGIIKILPSGWRFPELCRAKIIFNNCSYQAPDFVASPLSEKCVIRADGKVVGSIEVVYTRDVPKTEEGYFLEKEQKLIRAIADRIGHMVVYRQMKSVMNEWELSRSKKTDVEKSHNEWEVVIDFFRHTDHSMLLHICRKLINHMLIYGIKEASEIYSTVTEKLEDAGYSNYPTAVGPVVDIVSLSERAFKIAEKYIGSDEITKKIKMWIQEEKAYSLIKAIGSIAPSLRNISEEALKLRSMVQGTELLYSPKERWMSVALISRFLSDRSEFVSIAKQYINYRDFFDIIPRIIYPVGSQGKLGGKSAGLFLAQKILEKESVNYPELGSVKTPKTWYIATDAITAFLQYNNLEELNEQKYNELQEVRIEYPNIIQLMKNSKLPPEIIKSLSMALDDFGDVPLIVRSSSVLEDQAGAAFSGKYKSLFLANRGLKQERLEALTDAVIEVYASVFGPDPIQYRAERGLLDFHEEMGIMIQEVVGTKVGRYFFPLFSGVAFSNNEYRWSPRIKREDGLLRIVPGLGTRAVDRLSDDFPILLSPEQPGIRVNIVPEEIKRYSPKKMDVINLEKRTFETVDVTSVLKEFGNEIENIHKMVSILKNDHMIRPNRYEIDFEQDDLVVTFDGMIADSKLIKLLKLTMKTLEEKLGLPVDIEFAFDGKELYLLQCRPQSFREDSLPAPIPQDIPHRDIIFSANRYISNGLIQNISHIVYIDPDGYSRLSGLEELKSIGRVVGLLNSILPKRQFILIGPGRWGSRGDIKLGVSVSYADICNTAALIEVARKKTGYMPELSFGTHFFQDLVEANIRFLPLYPDDTGNIFNERFLLRTTNILGEIFPEYKRFEEVIKVISVPDAADGKTLSIAMNAELGEALGFLSSHVVEMPPKPKPIQYDDAHGDDKAWRWRYYMAEQLALRLDPDRFGVKALYLIGSTNNGTASQGSDIDLLVHFQGTSQQKAELVHWLEGWSLCLAEMNYMKTGYRMDGLLDVHILTDDDIRRKTSFAIKIGSVTEPATPLQLKQEVKP